MVGVASLAILEVFGGSEVWPYRYFATAVTKLYWAFVIPLAGLIDEVRRMFETKQEIRRVARANALAKERDKGRREERERIDGLIAEARQRFGIRDEATGVMTLPLTPEVEDFLRGESSDSDD